MLILLPFCFTGRALLTGGVYGPVDLPYMSEPLSDYRTEFGMERIHNGALSDLYMQMFPWQSAVRQSLARGEWPLWNPHQLCGSILAANMQSTVYDPLHLLALLLPHAQALTFGAAMTFFLAALFAFAFVRALGVSEAAALVAAAIYMFCEPIAFFVEWPLGRAWALFPLVMLGVRAVVRETTIRSAIVLTLSFVLIIVAGHPESVLHIVAVGVAYGSYEVLVTRRFRSIRMAAACGVIALLLTAVLLLPFAAVAPHSTEYHVRKDHLANAEVQSSMETVTRRMGLSFFAWYGGQPERDNATAAWEPTNVRVGGIAFALAAAALIIARKRRDTWFFAGLAVICFLGALTAWPVAHALHALPLFDIAVNDRLAFAAAFAIAVLSALAVDAWIQRRGDPSPHQRRMAGYVAGAVALALAIGAFAIRDARIAAGVQPELITALLWSDLLPLVGVAVLFLLHRTPPRMVVALLLGLVLLQRTVQDGQIYPTLPPRAFYPSVPILRYMQDDTSGPFRMAGLHYAFLPDAAALYGLEDARGYEAMTFQPLYQTYALWSQHAGASFNNIYSQRAPLLSFLNIKYLIGSRDAHPDEQWKLVMEDRTARLLENTRVLPRAFIPRLIRYEQKPESVLAGMGRQADFAERAWILAPHYQPHQIANGEGTLVIRRNGTAFDIDVRLDNDAWVVVSESAWPGWRAYVDGRRVEHHRANHAFIGVFVPRGNHRLELRYAPESFTRGRNISLLTAAGLIAFFVYRRYRFQQPLAV